MSACPRQVSRVRRSMARLPARSPTVGSAWMQTSRNRSRVSVSFVAVSLKAKLLCRFAAGRSGGLVVDGFSWCRQRHHGLDDVIVVLEHALRLDLVERQPEGALGVV